MQFFLTYKIFFPLHLRCGHYFWLLKSYFAHGAPYKYPEKKIKNA